jgi:hypothetical protein
VIVPTAIGSAVTCRTQGPVLINAIRQLGEFDHHALGAHSQDGAVFLTTSGEPISVQHAHLVEALLLARHGPSIFVLNFCGSLALHMHAQQVAAAAECWLDRLNDKQCQEFAGILYRGLACGARSGPAWTERSSRSLATVGLPRHGSPVTHRPNCSDRD